MPVPPDDDRTSDVDQQLVPLVNRRRAVLGSIGILAGPTPPIAANPPRKPRLHDLFAELEERFREVNELAHLTGPGLIIDYRRERLSALETEIESLELENGPETRLLKSVSSAIARNDRAGEAAVTARRQVMENQLTATENVLAAFKNKVAAIRGRSLTDAQADALLATTDTIIDARGQPLQIYTEVTTPETTRALLDRFYQVLGVEAGAIADKIEQLDDDYTITLEFPSPGEPPVLSVNPAFVLTAGTGALLIGTAALGYASAYGVTYAATTTWSLLQTDLWQAAAWQTARKEALRKRLIDEFLERKYEDAKDDVKERAKEELVDLIRDSLEDHPDRDALDDIYEVLQGNDELSFEGGTVGSSVPPAPWRIVRDDGTIRITDNASHGEKAIQLIDDGDLTHTAVGVDVDFTDVVEVVADMYPVSVTPYWGYVKLRLDSPGTGQHLHNIDHPGKTEHGETHTEAFRDGEWHRDISFPVWATSDGQKDLANLTGVHTLMLVASGHNNVIWDNIRFLNEHGEAIPAWEY